MKENSQRFMTFAYLLGDKLIIIMMMLAIAAAASDDDDDDNSYNAEPYSYTSALSLRHSEQVRNMLLSRGQAIL